MDYCLKGIILDHTLKSYQITSIGKANVLSGYGFLLGYKYKCPSKRRIDRLRKQKFLAQFKRDLELVPVPLLELGHSPHPSALAGPAPAAVAVQTTKIMVTHI